jgi:hypothetical protein
MSRIEWQARVDADGVLRVSHHLGAEFAGADVTLVAERRTADPEISGEAWQSWVDSISGTWPADAETPETEGGDARKE